MSVLHTTFHRQMHYCHMGIDGYIFYFIAKHLVPFWRPPSRSFSLHVCVCVYVYYVCAAQTISLCFFRVHIAPQPLCYLEIVDYFLRSYDTHATPSELSIKFNIMPQQYSGAHLPHIKYT